MNTKKTEPITKVIFRKFNKTDIIALFPYEYDKYTDTCTSYMHVGQHSGDNYPYCIQTTKPAKEAEYLPLFNELTGIGYNLQIIKKYNHKNR
jgi:hypothetical protein